MKPSRKWLIIVGIFFAIGLACLLIGFSISGFDVIGWFGSKYAIWFYCIMGIYLIVLVGLLIKDKLDKSY